VTNAGIRRNILKTLYERFTEHPYNRVSAKEFKEALDISLKELHFNIIYLEEKGFVELQKPLEGSIFVGARITPKGIDIVEDEYQMDILFPEGVPEEPAPAMVFVEVDRLIAEVEKLNGCSTESKELIIEEVKGIKLELSKSEPSYLAVKKYADHLKERNYEVYQKLLAIIKNPAVARLLSNAARKELGI
jgi:hypothetical protein